MKIEKLNDNQIRCTLTGEDLAKRNLRLSELAYGSEKTQNLFREMVKQADYEYGFETDNIPLVVEAIPTASGNIVLIITKIDDPEELDTRFSRFSPYNNPEIDEDEDDEDADEYINSMFSKPEPAVPSFGEMLKEALTDDVPKYSFSFTFTTLSAVVSFSRQAGFFKGNSSLFKTSSGEYQIIISPENSSKDEFKNVCLVASEYGNGRSIPDSAREFIREHSDVIIANDAINKLAEV
ncbi:MAG: adaptor protein MecA [Lachnospiraceae bacterium]|nr:adaptor protein MecA [Lachnospiraceae bacterium]